MPLLAAGRHPPLMSTGCWKRSHSAPAELADVLKEGLPGDPLAVHHVFPKKFMTDRDVAVDRLNSLANYAVPSQPDNAALGSQSPFDVWRGRRKNQREWASVQLCFTALDHLLHPEAYDEFLTFRSAKIAEQINQFLGLG